MKGLIEIIKKYKVYILTGLMLIFFFRSCSKSTSVRKSDKLITEKEVIIDSLVNVINLKNSKIDSFPEIIRIEKINIHLEYDNWISERDRGKQLMELHSLIKNNVKELQK